MGERFGNYEIIRKLAAGGMAEVFLAKQTSLGGFERLVCIKRILPHLTASEDFVAMFQDEARIAANLTHPNVAQIYDIGEIEDSYFIAMEYVRGEDLRQVYNSEVGRGRAMPLAPAAQIIMYGAAGLDYAHRQTTIDGRPLGIVHRDISPQNILITYDGHVKIVDFGVAKAANKVAETRSGVLKGKYSYMSPEQAAGDPIDARTDIFALAVTLYEVTTGTRLFKRESELDTLHAVIECAVTPPGRVLPDYDTELEAILLRALSYSPDDRYATAGELQRDLERFLIGREHPTSPSSLGDYMQDLFAEKLADELLFGGQPWSEENTSSESERAGPAPTNPAAPKSSATQVDNTWGDSAGAAASVGDPDELWDSLEGRDSWDGGADLDGETATTGLKPTTRIPDSALPERKTTGTVEYHPVAGEGARARPTRRGTPWLTFLAAAVLMMGAGFGLALVLTSNRGHDGGPMSGPLDIDSEPRGARVEISGPGAPAYNDRYGGHRTPFTIQEGVRVDAQLRARFLLDGYEAAVVDLPALEIGVVPKPLFVELIPNQEGAESGTLMLLSRPDGAEVWVNGEKQTRTTPLTDVRVRGGQVHKIEFRKTGYKPRWESRHVESGSRTFVEVTLRPSVEDAEPQPPTAGSTKAAPAPEGETVKKTGKRPLPKKRPQRATLTVLSPHNLRVSVDNHYVGETPIRKLVMEPGLHRIRAESPQKGFILNHKVRLTAGKNETVELQPGRGNLAVNASPWAWVRIGRETPSETPVRLEIFAGEYQIGFVCPDGRKKRRNAKVVAGQTATVTVNCRK